VLRAFDKDGNSTPGIRNAASRDAFVEQLLESIRRVSFPAVVSSRPISPLREDPSSTLFDPIRAAILCTRSDKDEEAFWLVFLSVHFGKHARSGWQYVRSVYGKLGKGGRWDWKAASANPGAFRKWLNNHEEAVRATGGGFGNHRKYQSLSASSSRGTGAVVESYLRWVAQAGTHRQLMQRALNMCSGKPTSAFDTLYREMDAVLGFGRTARFDYLTMVGKLGICAIEPGSAYLVGATGPLAGARLLFANKEGPRALDRRLISLAQYLGVGMQVLEDALCNWQKSPSHFVPFRG
jgi:alpha-glutamyl/putrescinyl thymine pyrophosphorylase-like protein